MLTMTKALQRHAREFLGAFKNLKFDRDQSGLWFPEQNSLVTATGLYTHRVRKANGEVTPWVTDKNLLPTEGLTYMLGAALGGESVLTAWYVALYATSVSPAANWTAANWVATASEIVSGSEGYSESTRVAWQDGTAAAAAINNNANPAAFTIVTATTLSVNGAALVSASAKSATTGKLASAVKFSATRTLNNTDVFEVKYAVSLTSS